MEGSFKLVTGAAVVGIFLGVAGLVFGIISRQETEELRSDFAVVQGLVEKIQQVEESSNGISATALRVRQEVEALREGTQGAFDQVSSELTRLRNDLNQSIAAARKIQERVVEITKLSAPEVPVVAEEPADVEPVATVSEPVNEQPETGGETYMIRSGDTLTRVAAAHGVSVDALTAANPTVDPRRLQIGQEIRIPAR